MTPPPPVSLTALVGTDSSTIPGIFKARALATPERVFLRWMERTWTYRDALSVICGVRSLWHELAPIPRPRVVTYLSNRPELMWAWLGTAFAGGTLVTINPKHRGPLLGDMLRRAHGAILVTESSLLDELRAIDPVGIDCVVLVDPEPVASSLWGVATRPFAPVPRVLDAEPPSISPADPACILYTSGTTGRSKAVVVSHNQYTRGAARLVDAFGLNADDVFHNWLPLCHLAGQLHMTLTAVICGGTVALFPAFSTARFWDDIRSARCSVLCGFASILHFIWSLPPSAEDARSTLRVGIFAGIPIDLQGPFEQRFGMTLAENYGMTEADPITYPRSDRPAPSGSCGLAGDDFEVTILDDEDRELPAGALGEIAVRPRTPHVMSAGYEDDAEATLTSRRNLWFHTGDLGTLDERGFLYFKGRKSHYIRRRGENVSAAELEAILLAHPDISECVAVGVPSNVGEEDIKVAIVPRASAALTAAAVHCYALERMASFMVPRYIEIREALPRTELGKVKLPEVRALSTTTWDATATRGKR